MKNLISIIVIYLSFFSLSYGQIFQVGIEEPYDIDEIDIRLNNWNLMRTDYTDTTFRNAIGLQAPTRVAWSDNEVQEFGHDYFVYDFLGNSVAISGSALSDAFYVAKFEIVNAALTINNIKVGDPINLVLNTFAKHYTQTDRITIYYDDTAISFYHTNSLITKITYWTPL